MNRKSSKTQTALFVLPWSLKHIGGVNQVVIKVAQTFQQLGYASPTVLIIDWYAKKPMWEEVQGITTVRWRIRSHHTKMGLKERITYHLWEKKFIKEFGRFCQKHNVAAINIHYPGETAFSLNRIANNLSQKLPVILSFHGADITDIAKGDKASIRCWKELAHKVEGVVVCSDALGQRLCSTFNASLPYIAIHNGVTIPSHEPPPKEECPIKKILTVGKYEHKKGQDILLRAFAELVKSCSDVELVLIGATEKALPELIQLAKDLKIDDKTKFYQDIPRQDMKDFYAKATIFCLPSRKEGFPLVLLEAATFKLPLVATAVDGVPELITDSKDGILVAPEDHKSLAEKLYMVLDEKNIREEMAEKMYQRVVTNFSWDATASKYNQLIQDITHKTSQDEIFSINTPK